MSFPFVVVVLSISIHALVKRATWTHKVKEFDSYISIHALVKRATDETNAESGEISISIHALVKRATLCKLIGWKRKIFQSTPS